MGARLWERSIRESYREENFACAESFLSVFVFESDERDRRKGKQSEKTESMRFSFLIAVGFYQEAKEECEEHFQGLGSH